MPVLTGNSLPLVYIALVINNVMDSVFRYGRIRIRAMDTLILMYQYFFFCTQKSLYM
jgi:hypothetical protein